MASKKLIFDEYGEKNDEQQTLGEADEVPSSESDSDSKSEEEEEKPESGEDGSGFSSPSASDFIIMPALKPSEKKKTPASKKFSEKDEIVLLKGLSTFWANGRNNKWAEFHLFIKDNEDLSHQFTKIQVSEKIRGLKRKFENNLERSRANEGRLDFSDAHEAILFELSKALWLDDKGNADGIRKRDHDEENKIPKNQKPKKQKQVVESDKVEFGKEEFESAYPLLCSSFNLSGIPTILREKCFLIGREKGQNLEEEWRAVCAKEVQLQLKKMDLIKRDLEGYNLSK